MGKKQAPVVDEVWTPNDQGNPAGEWSFVRIFADDTAEVIGGVITNGPEPSYTPEPDA